MAWLGAGLLIFVLVMLVRHWFVATPAADLARAARTFVAAFGAISGTGLLMFGRIGLGLAVIAATVMAFRALLVGQRGADPLRDRGGDAGVSEVTTDLLRMRLDRRTGALEGEVLQGAFTGRSLGMLGCRDLLGLLADAQRDDPPSVALLEAYLDRRFPDWRGGSSDARGDAGRGAGRPAADGPLDERTALEILGLGPDASADDVKAAHRRLMAQMHPDRGGSTWIASRLNAAKEYLLRLRGG